MTLYISRGCSCSIRISFFEWEFEHPETPALTTCRPLGPLLIAFGVVAARRAPTVASSFQPKCPVFLIQRASRMVQTSACDVEGEFWNVSQYVLEALHCQGPVVFNHSMSVMYKDILESPVERTSCRIDELDKSSLLFVVFFSQWVLVRAYRIWFAMTIVCSEENVAQLGLQFG